MPEMMKALSWNCRGLGHPSKNSALRDLLNQEKPDIILLQETKQGDQDMENIINKMKNYTGTIMESRGASGGISTIWNQNAWEKNGAVKTQN